MPEVISAIPLKGYRLDLEFSTHEHKIFDVSRFFKYPAFKPLEDPDFFKSVFVERGRPMWGDKTIDISPNMLTPDFRPSGFVD
jgi:hypothetical protein